MKKAIKTPIQKSFRASRKKQWKEEFYVRIYRLASEGLTNGEIAQSLGIGKFCFDKWLDIKPAVRDAVEQGRKRKEEIADRNKQFFDYVAGRMPSHLKEAWGRLLEWSVQTNTEKKIEGLLADKGDKFRQHLWAYALAFNNFDATQANKFVGVGPATIKHWSQTDPDFAQVLDVVLESKKDMVEASLLRLVAAGDSPAVIFANKTLNANRGYASKTTLKIEGEMTHRLREEVTMQQVLEELDIDVQLKVLEAIRKVKGRGTGELGSMRAPMLEAHNLVKEIVNEDE